MASPAPLHIRLLGDLELRRGDAVLALPPSRRTRALLGYLVASGAPQSRSALCDLLWEGPDDPRASLRWSLTKLRALVDDAQRRRLAADRERVGFDAHDCEVDVIRVRSLLAGGAADAPLSALEEAADLLRGEFLDGLDLPACYRFHHWCMALREQHGGLRRAVLDALVARLAPQPERALPYAHAMVAADPLAEVAHAALVHLLCAAGRYPDAERHYEWARELLRREVAWPGGGPLDDAIRRARRELRETGATQTDAPAAPAPPATNLSPAAADPAEAGSVQAPLLGRAAEHALIDRALGRHLARSPSLASVCAAERPAGRVVGEPAPLLLFTGEPGIGKTRVLDHLAQRAAACGRRVIRGRCFEAEMVRPYGPWLDALRGLSTDSVPAAVLAQAAPLLAGQAAEDGNRERLFDAAVALLRSLAAVQPLVLLFDDLQWIDEASAALLHYVARTTDAATPLLLAGAARAGEVDDNARAKGLLHSLAREGGLQRHALCPLGEADARVLLDAADVDTVEALRQTGGNPLYLLELARAARRGTGATGRSIDALLDDRLRSLDDAARDLLGWAAAMGGALRPDLLADAAGLPLAEVLMRLERFEQLGLIRPAGPGRFDFAHDLLRQAVYRALSQPRRQAMHRQLARALGTASRDDPWLHGEIVRHAGLANDPLGAARACLAAGEHCLRVFANAEAARAADRGLACVGELLPGAERVRLEIGLLGLRVAAAAVPGGRRLPALAPRIEAAIQAAQSLALHAEAGEGWQMLAFWQQQASDTGRTQEATLAAERLTRRADAATHCRQLANSGRCLLDIEADPARGRELLAQAETLAAELDLQVMEIEWGRGLIDRAQGRLDAACDALARAVALARLTANHWREFECLVWLATVEFEHGRYAEVQRHVGEIVEAAARMGDAQAPFAQALGALSRLRQGQDGERAELALTESLQHLRELDDKAHLAYALNEAAALALAVGRREAAAACAAEALTAARAVRRPTEVAVAIAALARTVADPAEAAAWLRQAPQGIGSARAEAALAAARALSTPAPTIVS
jgi:DNA-binding SARP family transcriptional activator